MDPRGSGTHRRVWREGGVLVLAQGAAEGLEGLAVLFVLLDGGLDDLKPGHKEQEPSARGVGRQALCLCPRGRGPVVTTLPPISNIRLRQKPHSEIRKRGWGSCPTANQVLIPQLMGPSATLQEARFPLTVLQVEG